MELHHALLSRRTIQRFRPGPVEDQVIERALEAAVSAPNHKATRPVRFVLPGALAREVVFRVGLRLKSAKKGTSPELEARVREDLLAPDRLIVVTQVVADDPNRAEEDYATCACATYAILLSLHADGVGAKWGTGGITRDPEVLAALGIDAPRERITAFVWVGWPEIVPTAHLPAIADVVRRVP
ncbi:MAG: nitroreductase family protein [Myxococcota bacterium]